MHMEDHMEITVSFNGKIAQMKVEGIINSDNAYVFQEELQKILKNEVSILEIDLSECRNISSTGIGKLLLFYKEFMTKNGEIEIVKSSPAIYELFTMIKLNQLFTVNL
jgi:anti-anti-sigma factor